MRLLEVGSILQLEKTIKPLQKQRAQQHYVNKRVPVKPQTMKSYVENSTEMWHFRLFHVLNEEGYSLLIAPHRTDVFENPPTVAS